MPIEEPRPIFDRMSGGQEFDVAEYSSSEFVQRFANKQCPFVALPVFPSRCFRHGFIAINKRSGIKTPKDLEGKRVALGSVKSQYSVAIEKAFILHGADPKKVQAVLQSNDAVVMRSAALAGAGLAILPSYLVADDLEAGRLRRVLPGVERVAA